ncbi:MAG TPA: DUF58 domain-containing protein [Pyrinomonadaceae bacterium]|nr:DUF58 domain-containing protein [Pyrinomonadaceae bacterium]
MLGFLKRWRNTILGGAVVLSGVSAAAITVAARRGGDWELARLGAITSLLFAVLILVFVVPPLARSARAEAARLDLPLQVTGGGVVFLSIYAVVTFAAWNTGNNLLFLVFSVLTSALFVAWSAARASLRDLAVSARFPDHIFAGEAAPVIVGVHNRKRWLPSFSVVVEARGREGGAPAGGSRWRPRRRQKRVLAYFMYVPRRARVEQRVEQTFERRGRALVEGFEISTKFPFGFFRVRRRLRARDVEIIVYPKPERASDELHLLPMEAGRTQAARRGAGHDLHSLREYQHRDDMRHIDWKATARQKRLFVREFTAEDERRVHVAFDACLPAEAGEEARRRFERGVTAAASLVAHFIEERAEVRLTLGGEEGRYGSGREHLYASLRRLALVEPEEAADPDARRADFWRRIEPAAAESARAGYCILLTTAPPGTIPAHLWRKSHVIYL